jgi:hypothetical protein
MVIDVYFSDGVKQVTAVLRVSGVLLTTCGHRRWSLHVKQPKEAAFVGCVVIVARFLMPQHQR